MAILLKELTIRYSPAGGSLSQLLRDFAAMFALWKSEGGKAPNVVSQRRTEIIDDVFEQVATQLGEKLIARFDKEWKTTRQYNPKLYDKMVHSFKVQDWMDFYASVDSLLTTIMGSMWASDFHELSTNPKSAESTVSPSLLPLIRASKTYPDVPKKELPWVTRNKAAAAKPSPPPTPPSPPRPEVPREKFPTLPANLPPEEKPFAQKDPKQVGGNWETLLGSFGYVWDETEKMYKNAERGTKLQVYTDNTSKVFMPKGTVKDFPNLGLLFRTMAHNKTKRHKNEPVAQVTEGDFVPLYEFLYS